ncbi:hypothetical protein AVEN_137743-1 [Araneus ventricosus]|uniref:Uncharacterized protein n=1 Tax=Araneus ventricosus TaxID=182803 RepID=A0A4Y2P2P9_ARAVE|nr:hypothetical protein AVEN_137743-1 [Araneus ventricosus]
MLNSALYVKDLYFGADSVSEAFALSSDAVSILKSGGFNLRKLRSNSCESEKLRVENGLVEGERAGVVKVLGLNWSPDRDVSSLELKGLVDCLKTLKNNKRYVLQTAARIFDPVGLIAPFVVRIGKSGVYGAGLFLANSSWRNFMCRRQILFWMRSELFIALLRMLHLKRRD